MFYPDLSPYTYSESSEAMLNVGWLAKSHAIPEGRVDAIVRDQLVRLAREPQNLTRGLHYCEFCEAESPLVATTPDRPEVPAFLGSGRYTCVLVARYTQLRPSSSTTSTRTHTCPRGPSAMRCEPARRENSRATSRSSGRLSLRFKANPRGQSGPSRRSRMRDASGPRRRPGACQAGSGSLRSRRLCRTMVCSSALRGFAGRRWRPGTPSGCAPAAVQNSRPMNGSNPTILD